MSNPTSAESIFLAALEKSDATARTAYLDEVCKDDSDLRRRVQRLLDAHAHAGDFLEKPIAGNQADVPSGDRTSAGGSGQVRPTLEETQAESAGVVASNDLSFLAQ